VSQANGCDFSSEIVRSAIGTTIEVEDFIPGLSREVKKKLDSFVGVFVIFNDNVEVYSALLVFHAVINTAKKYIILLWDKSGFCGGEFWRETN